MNRARLTAAVAATCAVAAAASPAVSAASAASKPRPPADTKKATTFSGTPAVGALFDSATSKTHFCTASVVTSPKGDVLMTAAHCLQGTTKGWSFAPAFHSGVAPYGRWTITGAYVDPQWLTNQNPQRDYAFLTVAPRTIGGTSTEIQSVTGSDRLGTGARKGESVTVPAYPHGTDNDPVTCTAPVYLVQSVYPAFNCNPYVGGTSGSPWLAQTPDGPEVVGLVAGLHQGGCQTWTSYSPPLGSHARATYKRAVAGGKGDVAPKAGSDGCSTGL